MDLQNFHHHHFIPGKFNTDRVSHSISSVPDAYCSTNPSPLEAMAERFGKMVRGIQFSSVNSVPTSHLINDANSELACLEQPAEFNDRNGNNAAISIPLVFCRPPFNYLQSKIRKTVYLTEDVVSNPYDLTAYRVEKSEVYDGLFYTPCLCHSNSMTCSSPKCHDSGHLSELTNVSSECLPNWRRGLHESHVFGINKPEELLNMNNEKSLDLTDSGSGCSLYKPSYPGPMFGSSSSSSPITYSSKESYQLKTEDLSNKSQQLYLTNSRDFRLVHPTVEQRSYQEITTAPISLRTALFGSEGSTSFRKEIDKCNASNSPLSKQAHNIFWNEQNYSNEKDTCELNMIDTTDAITKPPFSYITLIVSAMGSKPSKQITLNEIYAWIMSTFAYYRKNTRRWQNSIRHALSFNDCFIKIPRPSGEAGKGSYWTVHPRAVDMFENGSSMRRNRKFVDETRIRGSTIRRRMVQHIKDQQANKGRHGQMRNRNTNNQLSYPSSINIGEKYHSACNTENTFCFDQTCSNDWNASEWNSLKQPDDFNWLQQHQQSNRVPETDTTPSPVPFQNLPIPTYNQAEYSRPYCQSVSADKCSYSVLNGTESTPTWCYGPSESPIPKHLSYSGRICQMFTEWSNYDIQGQPISSA